MLAGNIWTVIRGGFFVIFGCHPSLDQKSLSYKQRLAWIAERKSITWVLHMPKDLNINNLLVVPQQNKHLTDFFSWTAFTWQCQVHNPATILPTGMVISSAFSVVMCCQKSLSTQCSHLLEEHDDIVPLLLKIVKECRGRLVHSQQSIVSTNCAIITLFLPLINTKKSYSSWGSGVFKRL